MKNAMKNYFFVLSAVLIFSFTLAAQNNPQTVDDLKAEAETFKESEFTRFEIRYDKKTDKSSVYFVGDVIYNELSYPLSGSNIQLLANFQFDSNRLDRNIETFTLIFLTFGKRKEFLKSRNFYVLTDTEKFDFGVGEYNGDVDKGFSASFNNKETLSFEITREQLEKFAKAKTLKLKVGNREFNLKNEMRRGFANTLALGSVENN